MLGGSSRRLRAALCASYVLVSGAGWVAPALAQTAESQAAEALFRQAKALLEKGELEQACEKFAASQALEPGLGTLLYLGDCYERAGHFASALNTFRSAASLAKERDDDERLRLARIRVSALEPRAPKLEIRNGPAPQGLDLVITVGGTPLAPTDVGRTLVRDAGTYDIRFSAPGYEPFVSHIELKNSANAVVTIPRLVPLASASGSEPAPFPNDGSSQRTIAWIVGGTGAALLATAGVFAGLAVGKNNDSKSNCDPNDESSCSPTGVSQRDDAKTFANIATVATVLGGLGVASGVVLYVTAPSTEERLIADGAIVGVRGSFF
jgi:tetratricopeptide (TPR) repeat protein